LKAYRKAGKKHREEAALLADGIVSNKPLDASISTPAGMYAMREKIAGLIETLAETQ